MGTIATVYLGILTRKNGNIHFAGLCHSISALSQFNATKIIYAYLHF